MRDFKSSNTNQSDASRQRHNHRDSNHRSRHEHSNFRTNNRSSNENHQREDSYENHRINSKSDSSFYKFQVPQAIPQTFSNQLPPQSAFVQKNGNSNASTSSSSSHLSSNQSQPTQGQNQRSRSPYLREKNEETQNVPSSSSSSHKILKLSKRFDLAEFARNQRRNHIGKSFAIVKNSLPENHLIPILPKFLLGGFP